MLCFLFLLLLPQAYSASITSQQQQHPINIFVLAGQSNMAGRGGVTNDTKTGETSWDGIVPPQCQPNPSIFRLSASLNWVPAQEPLHADIDYNKTNGIGPGMAFANAILTKDPSFGLVGLVPCAIGSTNISQWARGGFLYEQLLGRAKVAQMSRGGDASTAPTIRAMLWYQGESDTYNREDAEAYKGRLEKFFTDLRKDLQLPTLRIIQVAIASGKGAYVETVRKAQLGVNLPNVECVDAKGLPLEADKLHLTTPAQVQLGETMADVFLHSLTSLIRTATNSAATLSTFFLRYLLLVTLLSCFFIIS